MWSFYWQGVGETRLSTGRQHLEDSAALQLTGKHNLFSITFVSPIDTTFLKVPSTIHLLYGDTNPLSGIIGCHLLLVIMTVHRGPPHWSMFHLNLVFDNIIYSHIYIFSSSF